MYYNHKAGISFFYDHNITTCWHKHMHGGRRKKYDFASCRLKITTAILIWLWSRIEINSDLSLEPLYILNIYIYLILIWYTVDCSSLNVLIRASQLGAPHIGKARSVTLFSTKRELLFYGNEILSKDQGERERRGERGCR